MQLQGTQRHDGNGHDIHRFREKDILAFIKQYPQEINLGKTDQGLVSRPCAPARRRTA